jgi:uncharacterized protein (DUF305 family)
MKQQVTRFQILLLAIFTLGISMVVLADDPTDGRAGRAELRFLQGMVDHHQMALDMADDCLKNASTDVVKTLCQNVIDAQSTEIVMMQEWLLNWYNVEYEAVSMLSMEAEMGNAGHGGHGGHGNMPHSDPPMMMGMMAGLNRLDGQDYDIAWLESMIDHHDDAIHMSERLLNRLADSGHTELRELAQQIIADQSAEIETMEGLISELGG